ncbi:MAG TPA: hypothetical protein DCS43_13990, partial [Verrucomicrobia bacterium]|nr:hypothetical protein [Verrucomicrobiota bacterium]
MAVKKVVASNKSESAKTKTVGTQAANSMKKPVASSPALAKSSPVAAKNAAKGGANAQPKAVVKPSTQAKPSTSKSVNPTGKPAAKPVAGKVSKSAPSKVGFPAVKANVPASNVSKDSKKESVGIPAKQKADVVKPSRPVAAQIDETEVRETDSTINTGNGGSSGLDTLMRGHADIAKGIEARKAAAKAKSIARLSHPAAEKVQNLRKLTPKQAQAYEVTLLRLRDELSRQIAFLRGASLTRSDEVNPEEDGSDAFERQLALKLAQTEGDAIFEIDEALQRIKDGTYAICQDCGCVVSPARLKALPFVRRCVEC